MNHLKQNRITLILLAASLSLWATPALADGLTAQQIVDKSLERNKFGFQNAIAGITLKLVSKRGSERVREVQIKSIERDGLGKSLVRFHAPADVAGTGFLLIENADADDDQYLYLPALGKVKRITGSQRNQRFMGTDLTYADMESRDLKNAAVTRMPDEKLGGNDTFVIEAIPKEEVIANTARRSAGFIRNRSFHLKWIFTTSEENY